MNILRPKRNTLDIVGKKNAVEGGAIKTPLSFGASDSFSPKRPHPQGGCEPLTSLRPRKNKLELHSAATSLQTSCLMAEPLRTIPPGPIALALVLEPCHVENSNRNKKSYKWSKYQDEIVASASMRQSMAWLPCCAPSQAN